MFPFSYAGLQNRVWSDGAADPTHKHGWHYYGVTRGGELVYRGPFSNKFPIPGLVVEYWIPPDEGDWIKVLNGLTRACKKSGRITVY